ncbi:unknown protein [Waddlia chondrophila 2032/99]|uniref:Uncharacterized protein n=1 Tax=Waddlia chondrophila 2032/99 TaxID=765953 RepID=F8LAJ7_9BACT|nr:unknown protein [Waddlia chondrophila 2032/99]
MPFASKLKQKKRRRINFPIRFFFKDVV